MLDSQELQESTAKFIGSTSMSASIACSEQFREFICAISKKSMDYYFQNKNVVRDPEIIIKRFNKNEMKNSLLDEGNKAFKNMIKKLSNFKFVNLMIDAATIYNMRVVHSTLSNPYSRLAPLPFRATEKKG